MNWIDYVLLGLLGLAAVQGFMKGFVREFCGLIGLALGIWLAVHLGDKIAGWVGMEGTNKAVAFLAVVIAVVVLLHLVGWLLTKVLDAAQMGLPNKLGGALLGAVRQAFLLSVVLNVLFVKQGSAWAPSAATQADSAVSAPLRAFAPAIVPALRESKWLKDALREAEDAIRSADAS